MARADALGLFWEDKPVIKEKKEAPPKRQPPERTWERSDYLPNYAEALAYKPNLFTPEELFAAMQNRERLVFDVECYPNYFLVSFKSITSGKVIYFERSEQFGIQMNIALLRWVMESFTLISFNGINYDVPVTALATMDKECACMFAATERIIVQQERPQDVLKSFKTKNLKPDHIDLIEVTPLRASLKLYGGRLHTPTMQDLPFPPGTVLSMEQIVITRWYNLNDLVHTELLYWELIEQVKLRESLSQEYGIDLRSRSDAQIAESVISHEVEKLNGFRCTKPTIPVGTCYKYKVPHFLRYRTPMMNWVLNVVANSDFIVDESGSIGMPPQLKELTIPIAGAKYQMGIGGLHSTEQSVHHIADENYILVDRDVASYYPSIILNQGLYPHHLGQNFLRVYKSLVDRRLAAKRSGNKVVADSLKITINGSFGKLGNKYSVIYSPDLLIQVTITGQLALLMLIEALELSGINVVSANTDGVVIKCPKHLISVMDAIVKWWEQQTNFETEDTQYKALYSRDVNNYIAVKRYYDKASKQWKDEFPEGTKRAERFKVKGAFAEKGSNGNSVLSKNPAGLISSDAAIDFLLNGTPIMTTLKNCKDVRRFVFVRNVKGGAVKLREEGNEYLGKSIRWYYAKGEHGELVYALNGNKVPRSDGAKPLMKLPDALPDDIDLEWYEQEAVKILKEVAYLQ